MFALRLRRSLPMGHQISSRSRTAINQKTLQPHLIAVRSFSAKENAKTDSKVTMPNSVKQKPNKGKEQGAYFDFIEHWSRYEMHQTPSTASPRMMLRRQSSSLTVTTSA